MYNRTLFIASGRGREKTVLSPTTGEYINETRGRFVFRSILFRKETSGTYREVLLPSRKSPLHDNSSNHFQRFNTEKRL